MLSNWLKVEQLMQGRYQVVNPGPSGRVLLAVLCCRPERRLELPPSRLIFLVPG